MASRRRLTSSSSQTRGWPGLKRRVAKFLLRAAGWELRGQPAPHFQHMIFYLCPYRGASFRWIAPLIRASLARKVETRTADAPLGIPASGWVWQYLDPSTPALQPLESSLRQAQSEGCWISVILVDHRRKSIDIHTPFLCSLHPDRASFYIQRAFRYMQP
ncbi:MAG: hypothetical protein RJA19_1142 [Bacteroidota bacterium]|jgi:hypothetical protein